MRVDVGASVEVCMAFSIWPVKASTAQTVPGVSDVDRLAWRRLWLHKHRISSVIILPVLCRTSPILINVSLTDRNPCCTMVYTS